MKLLGINKRQETGDRIQETGYKKKPDGNDFLV
jgi:hypothetical protein